MSRQWPPRIGRKALITGITGQDGSYLAELLLGKGYDVWGVIRRSSTFNTERIDHLYQDPHDPDVRLRLVFGDLNDASSLNRILKTVRPDEVYNLGAQSHVKVSFEIPEYTGEVTGLGAVRLLEAMRELGLDTTRFYQASSSELFGKALETPQCETTPFYPRSPYGAAKAYAFHIARNYREGYGMYAVNGILFNHECVTAETPVIVRRHGLLDILPIEDVVPHRTDPHSGALYTTEVSGNAPLETWDGHGWTRVTCMTARWNGERDHRSVHRLAARGALIHATADHVVFTCESGTVREKPAGTVSVGDSLKLIELPVPSDQIAMTDDEGWLLGILAAEGWIGVTGKVHVANQDSILLDAVAACWRRVTGGESGQYVAKSGFSGGRPVTQLRLLGAGAYARMVRGELYTRSGAKRVPRRVLNAGPQARLAFLRGFNAGDGLKSTPCTYEFQGFKTSSAALAAGLYWLVRVTLQQRAILCTEAREGRLYIQININSPDVSGTKGQHLVRPIDEVVRADRIEHTGWLFDLATDSGTFHAGVGQGWIHNSPRRGVTFVTRKITAAAARIVCGLQQRLFLGNLDARRDWGFAGDYVEAMWLMLQADEADDYVIATGETHSVREFCELAFARAGLPLRWEGEGLNEKGIAPDGRVLVEVDPRYFRPTEVELLLGDATKARERLGWRPRVGFRELVEMMVDADLAAVGKQ